MDIKEAVEYLKIKNRVTKQQIKNGELWLDTLVEAEQKDIEATETVLAELEKKDKIINFMVEWFEEWAKFIDEENYYTIFRKMSKEDIKEYFKKKVEE